MYDYQKMKPQIFTEDGVAMLLEMENKARRLLRESGAVTMGRIMTTGDTWLMLACAEYLVELGYLSVFANKGQAQDQVFTPGQKMRIS